MIDPPSYEFLTKTVWGEARGEGVTGMIAVAHVINNRLKTGRFGRNIEAVVVKPYQFSCWNVGDPNLPLLRAWDWNIKDPSKLLAAGAASGVLLDLIPDMTNGATHYHTTARPANNKSAVWPPLWAKGMTKTAIIGNHTFYRD